MTTSASTRTLTALARMLFVWAATSWNGGKHRAVRAFAGSSLTPTRHHHHTATTITPPAGQGTKFLDETATTHRRRKQQL
mmetsp:Transcript_23329/g.51024  ORF Transcript_23329/g.51024 Transcript_23329/m.51024 type:complete len:80 (-) Transcript_23329:1845-2084(-)